jgi:hypothetical protein
VSGSSELQDPVALGATGSCHSGPSRDPRYDASVIPNSARCSPVNRHVPRLGLAATIVAGLLVGACNQATPTPSGRVEPTPGASSEASVPSTASGAPSVVALAGQTNTDWGWIWDELPADFPVYPGATPAAETQTEPVTAAFAAQGDARTIATWMQTELERATFVTEALNGPFEDGGFVLDSTGEGGCRLQVAVAPLGGLLGITVRYGAACPAP